MNKNRITLFLSGIVLAIFILSGCKQINKQTSKGNQSDSKQKEADTVEINSGDDYTIDSVAIFSADDYRLLKVIKYKSKRYHPRHKQKHSRYSKSDSYHLEYLNYIKGYPKSDTLIGDFDGDGIKELGIYHFELVKDTTTGYMKSIDFIEFPYTKIKRLNFDRFCGGTFKKESDLNNDGIDEIGVLCSFYGDCRYYSILTYKDGNWVSLIPSIESSYSMREAGVVLVEKDLWNNNYIIVRNMLYIPNDSMPEEYLHIGGGCCSRSNVLEYRIRMNDPEKSH